MMCLDVIAAGIIRSAGGVVELGALELEGDQQSGTDKLDLEGDQQSGDDHVENREA